MTTTLAATLAAEIRAEHQHAQLAFRTAVEHGVRCGKLLEQAKGDVPHGQWLPWLDAEFPGSRRTAQGYMRLARHAEDAQALAHLGIEGALRQLAAPPPERSLASIEADLRELLPKLRADLRRTYDLGAHFKLGYPSWQAFVDARFAAPPDWPEDVAAIIRAELLVVECETA